MANQWPDFATLPKPKTVRSVIIDEGSGIAERTGGAITFDVDSTPQGNGSFVHHCSLVVPKMAYRYPLLRVSQDTLDYPVTVVADSFPKGTVARSEAELRKALGVVFRSDATKRIVLQLLDLFS